MRRYLFLLTALLPFQAFSHEGPEHEIEELTERINKEGDSAELLLERAVEYQLIRKFPEAIKDLEKASRLAPHLAAIQRELGRAYFATGKTNEALQTVTRALDEPVKGAERASLLVTRAEILRPRKEYAKALDDANDAIEEYPDNVEWYLLRSQLQALLKLKEERAKDLEEAIKRNGSGVLQIEWIDALIDNEQYTLASEKIETEIKASRLRASWLIRRARVRLATGMDEDAKADLRAAVEELNGRISVSTPDASLLAERGHAYELLGDKEKALKDYNLAKDKGMADEWLESHILAVSGKDKDAKNKPGSRRTSREGKQL